MSGPSGHERPRWRSPARSHGRQHGRPRPGGGRPVRGDTRWITSTRGPDDEPVCEITWGPMPWYAPVADVRQTALDLMNCAAYAEWIHLLITKVEIPLATVEAIMVDMMRI